jgi:putative phage-type endonuclease
MLTEEQKELRKSGIGGSDSAAVAGLSRYKSNIDVYLEKIGFKDLEEAGEAAYWGNALEKLIADEYVKRNKEEVSQYKSLFKAEKYPWMIANIDGYISTKNAVLECKTCNQYKASEWGEQNTDEIPDEYLLQCAHYRIVTDCDFVAIAVLIGGQEYRQYRYEKNITLENKLINIEYDFWHKHVLPQEPPELKKYEDALKIFAQATDAAKFIDEGTEKKLNIYRETKIKIDELIETAHSLKAQICGYMSNYALLTDPLGNILATWKNKKINRFDTTLFKQLHPKLYQQFIKSTETREFRLKGVLNDE